MIYKSIGGDISNIGKSVASKTKDVANDVKHDASSIDNIWSSLKGPTEDTIKTTISDSLKEGGELYSDVKDIVEDLVSDVDNAWINMVNKVNRMVAGFITTAIIFGLVFIGIIVFIVLVMKHINT